jgi:NADH-quinone oxidoreductase subunit M
MLGALIYLYLQTPYPHSSEFTALYKISLNQSAQFWIFSAFFIAFAVKIPIVPFHTWQPDTYTTSPAAGSMILAGVMLKMGIYGIIRLLIPICHDALKIIGVPFVIIVILGLIYASVIALSQTDLKRFVAYASIAHVGLISAGAMSMNQLALQGAVFQMISHGVNVVGLFVIIDIIETRFGTRDVNHLGGVSRIIPTLAIFLMIIMLGTIALPLTNGFIGEFLLLIGLFEYNPWISFLAGTTIIFCAIYMLRIYQKVMLGTVPTHIQTDHKGLNFSDWVALIPLAVMIIATGCYPKPILEIAGPAIKTILSSLIISN